MVSGKGEVSIGVALEKKPFFRKKEGLRLFQFWTC
jgi:hypothetical protein